MDWIEKWRIDFGTLHPRKVRVCPVAGEYVLVEGDEHTSYGGHFFDTVEEAYAHAIKEAERSLRYSQDRLERLRRNQRLARAE